MSRGNSSPPAPPQEPASSERLDSWKEIAAYLKRDPRTVQRWEKSEGLPVHRHLHDKLGSVYAYKSELDTWWNQRRPGLETEPEPEPAPEVKPAVPSPPPILPGVPGPSRRDKILLALFVVAFLVIAAVLVRRIIPRTNLPTGKVMLAVLPFDNLSGDPEQEFFSDGLSEDLITQLGRMQPERLGVIAWTTVKNYKKSGKSIEEIGEDLRVSYVLEGSVRRVSNEVRINAQLIQVKDQTHLWSERYDRTFADVLAIQSEVAEKVAAALALELLPAARARLAAGRESREAAAAGAGGGFNPQAYEAYLKGRYFWNRREPEDLLKGIQAFKEAIARDPKYAPAYAGLADTYNLLGFYSVLRPRDAYQKSKEYAKKALQIDESLAEAHNALADTLYHYEYDWPGAEKEFRRAIELNPSYATAHHWYSVYLALRGRTEEGWAEIQKAQALDRLSLIINTDMALHAYYARRYDEAIAQCRATLALEPDFALAHFWLGRAYVEKKMYPEAIAALRKSVEVEPGNVMGLALLGHTYAVSGQPAEARRIIAQLQEQSKKQFVSAVLYAVIYAGLNDNDQVFPWAEKAYQERAPLLTRLKVDPVADSIRSDPRFKELIRRVGPPDEPARK